jgi:cellulose synthase/poly-beta-1,6-N-acetylglucosamine synthase-like glycosyltransferase
LIDFSFIHAATFAVWILSFLLTIYAGYYFIISLSAVRPVKKLRQFPPENRFAILIAARNEAQVIGNLIASLKRQNYPPQLYEIFVIPNNCTDHTRAVALESGASVSDCRQKVRSKGQVLSFVFEHFKKNGSNFDAYCIFDADNLADPNFLMEMNNALCSGYHAAQGFRDSKNPDDTIISSCYSIYYYTLNRLYNHARSIIGLSAVINGTGFMVSARAIKKMNGWNTVTMTEDLEFSALCAMNKIRIQWVPEAIIYDEQPLTFFQSWNQRKRWSFGMQQCLRNYARPLLKSFITEKNKYSLDVLLMLLATHMQLLGFLSFLLTITLTALRIHYNLFPQTDLAFHLLVSLDTSYTISVAVTLLVLLLERKRPARFIKGILFTWFFLMSWIPINCISICSRTSEWKQISHVRSLSISDILPAELNQL